MRKLILGGALILTGFANSAVATGVLADCEDCTSAADFVSAAHTQAIENEWSTVYVGNLRSLELKKYQVFEGYTKECDYSDPEPDVIGGSGICRKVKFYNDIEETVSSEDYNNFLLVAQQANKTKDVLSTQSVTVPSEVAESAWEIVNASYVETKLSHHFKSELFYENFSDNLLILAKSALSVVTNFYVNFDKPQIKFTFSDGSVAFAVASNFSYGIADSFELKFVSIVDADSNKLDLTKNEIFNVGQTYSFTDGNEKGYSTFLMFLSIYNLTITNASSVPSGVVTIMSCPNKICPTIE